MQRVDFYTLRSGPKRSDAPEQVICGSVVLLDNGKLKAKPVSADHYWLFKNLLTDPINVAPEGQQPVYVVPQEEPEKWIQNVQLQNTYMLWATKPVKALTEARVTVKAYQRVRKGKVQRVKQSEREVLFHGTSERNLGSILSKGIVVQNYKNWSYFDNNQPEKKVYASKNKLEAIQFGHNAATVRHDGKPVMTAAIDPKTTWVVLEAHVPKDASMELDKRVESGNAYTLDSVKPEWIKKVYHYGLVLSSKGWYDPKELSVKVVEAKEAVTRVYIPVPVGHPLVKSHTVQEATQRLRGIALLRERTTDVRQHTSHSKKGKFFYVRQHGRAVVGKATVSSIRDVNERVFNGKTVRVRNKLTKKQTGDTGEAIAIKMKGGMLVNEFLGEKVNNLGFDVINYRKGILYEVKAGLVSIKGKNDRKWRLTGDGIEAKDLVKIIKRKVLLKERIEKLTGKKFRMKTLTYILNPDIQRADAYEFDGLHAVIRWHWPIAIQSYKRTVQYA